MRGAFAFAAVLLLAGCTSPTGSPFPTHHETRRTPDSELFPGLTLEGTLDGSGEALHVVATARNDGPRTYKVETGCTTPWTDVVIQGNQTLQHRRPVATCLAFALREFPPGASMSFEANWTGILFDDEDQTFHDAPPGAYLWSVRFMAYAGEEDAATIKRLDLDFDVTVQ